MARLARPENMIVAVQSQCCDASVKEPTRNHVMLRARFQKRGTGVTGRGRVLQGNVVGRAWVSRPG